MNEKIELVKKCLQYNLLVIPPEASRVGNNFQYKMGTDNPDQPHKLVEPSQDFSLLTELYERNPRVDVGVAIGVATIIPIYSNTFEENFRRIEIITRRVDEIFCCPILTGLFAQLANLLCSPSFPSELVRNIAFKIQQGERKRTDEKQ